MDETHPMFAPRPSRARPLMLGVVVVVALVVIIALVSFFRQPEAELAPVSQPSPQPAAPQPPAPVCDDGSIDAGEECDGANLAGRTCESEGYPGGVPTCSACRISFTSCSPKPCVPNWQCGAWGVCSVEGRQTRTCTDLNSCGTLSGRPLQETDCPPPTTVTPQLPTAPAPASFAAGDEWAAVVWRPDEKDVNVRAWRNGVLAAETTCLKVLNDSSLRVDFVATRDENNLPVVYCYARVDTEREYCSRWTPVGITPCAYDAKLEASGTTLPGPVRDAGFSAALSLKDWKVRYREDSVELVKGDVVMVTVPSRKGFEWRYSPSHNFHIYAVWEYQKDGKVVRQVYSDVFGVETFLETPLKSGYLSGGWPTVAGSYGLTLAETIK